MIWIDGRRQRRAAPGRSARCRRRSRARRSGTGYRRCSSRPGSPSPSRHGGDGGVRAYRRARDRGEARDELDHLAHRHVAVGIRAVVVIAGQTALPVGRQQPQRVPALAPPGVRDLAALEDDVIDRSLGEKPARREAGMAGPDDDRGELLDRQTTSTVTFTGFVMHVVHGRALLRLRDDRLDVLLRRVRVDLERHLDVVVAVAHVAVDAEDAADVHLAFELRLDRAQLDAAILRDGRDAGREAAREPDEHVLDRRDAVVLRGEDLRMIGLERSSRSCASAPGRGRRSCRPSPCCACRSATCRTPAT